MKLIKEVKYAVKILQNPQPKIFCIGRNKTGTTTLHKTFLQHGFRVGSQPKAELLIDDYAKRDFKRIIRYCKSAQAFQDLPFSLPYTYMILDNAFPGSKFILTERDSDEQWYNSLIKFQSKKFNKSGVLPSKEDLQNATYREPGYAWKVNRILYDSPEDDLYNETRLKTSYNNHNAQVKDYFRHKDNLLVINVSKAEDYGRFCEFLSLTPQAETFPWENKTASLKN